MSSPVQCLGVGRSDYDVPPGLLLLAQNPVLSAGGGSIHQLSSNCNRFLSKILRTGTAAAAPRIRLGRDPLLPLRTGATRLASGDDCMLTAASHVERRAYHVEIDRALRPRCVLVGVLIYRAEAVAGCGRSRGRAVIRAFHQKREQRGCRVPLGTVLQELAITLNRRAARLTCFRPVPSPGPGLP